MRDDVADAVAAIFIGNVEARGRVMPLAVRVFFPDEAEVAQVLFPNRFVQMIRGLQIAFDFGRRGRAFAVERAAGREMHEQKRQRADDEQQRNQEEQAL